MTYFRAFKYVCIVYFESVYDGACAFSACTVLGKVLALLHVTEYK